MNYRERISVNQRLITDLFEDQSLCQVEYTRLNNSFKNALENDSLLDEEKTKTQTVLDEMRTGINQTSDRILELQKEITQLIQENN